MHDDVRAFLQADVPADERAPRGLQALLTGALDQRSADGTLQLVVRGYELTPMSRGRLAVVVHARTVRWQGARVAGVAEGREFLIVLPADGALDQVVAAARDACAARGRIVAQALSTMPDGWGEDVYPGHLLGMQGLPW